jgi:hypothetical protein
MNVTDLQQRLNKSHQGGPTFHYSIPPKADLRLSMRLAKKIVAKSNVILSEA